MIDIAFHVAGPEVAVGLVVLIAPEDGAGDPIVFCEKIELVVEDVDAKLVGFDGVGSENPGRAEFGDDEHFVRE